MTITTNPTWTDWIDNQPDDATPTHRVRLRIHVDVSVVVPPWLSTYEGRDEVVRAAHRMDPNDILAAIDYANDQFLPAGAKIAAVTADIEKL
jgi:hypothetical protein